MASKFPEEFKQDVVDVVRRGDSSIPRVAKDFGISESALRKWVAQADERDGASRQPGDGDAAELRAARKRIRELEQEAEVMRRAVGYFSRGTVPK